MAIAGEILQEIGRAYQYVFIGALESTVKPFQNLYHVFETPDKLTFQDRSGQDFSFDFSGICRYPYQSFEVFGECKGYGSAQNLLSEYKRFLAKAFVTSLDNQRNRNDHFWFVTNVPFACTLGRKVDQFDFIYEVLANRKEENLEKILGSGKLDINFIRGLAERVSVLILTDSYLKKTDIKYKTRSNENIWSILKKLHGGSAPQDFGRLADEIARKNNLKSANHIQSGKTYSFLWGGISARTTKSIDESTD